jgi:hypothetical protein
MTQRMIPRHSGLDRVAHKLALVPLSSGMRSCVTPNRRDRLDPSDQRKARVAARRVSRRRFGDSWPAARTAVDAWLISPHHSVSRALRRRRYWR